MPRLPEYKCFGFQSGTHLSPSPFRPSFSLSFILFRLTFSTSLAAFSVGRPFILLTLLILAADSALPWSSPFSVASRLRLPRMEESLSFLPLETERPRTFAPSSPFSLSSFSTSEPFFIFLRVTGLPFLDLASLRSMRRCLILLWSSSRKPCVCFHFLRTSSSSPSEVSAINIASSLSSISSFLSMSGSTKSMTLWPSMISGTTSYFQEVSSSSARRQRSTE
mmetsp:Transcript_76982/g.124581  ORF Transcript_76982/g.124581 Transcript_76982/m.124581 type:complete len:222 (+) Transcript_76982:195-860(+)